MLVENPYPGDGRVRKEATTLVAAGYPVTVIALAAKGQKLREHVKGVSVYRVPTVTVFDKILVGDSRFRRWIGLLKSLFGYFIEYIYFTSACFFISVWVAFRERFDVVHAHNPPDTLFVVGVFYRLFGKTFVFDHHDLSPELYLSRYRLNPKSRGIVYKTLVGLERLSLRTASICIATNESYKEVAVERGKKAPDRVFVVRNGPDLERVKEVPPDERLRSMGKSILVYVGAMNPQDGLDYMLRALRHLAYTLGRSDFYCVAIGPGDSLGYLRRLSTELELDDYVWFTGVISDADLMRYLSSADICLDPNPSSPMNDVSTWIKVMEYMAMGKPVVSFDLKETRVSADGAALYAPPNDEVAFAERICELMDRPESRKEMGEIGKQRVKDHLQWNVVSKNLLLAYEALGNGKT